MGAHILTTQQHPEITPAVMTALTEELADQLRVDNLAAARATIGGPVETRPLPQVIARFFEPAAGSPGLFACEQNHVNNSGLDECNFACLGCWNTRARVEPNWPTTAQQTGR